MSNHSRFFDTNGNACFVPTTDGPTGYDSTPQPGVRLPSRSQCYDGCTINSLPRPPTASCDSTRQPVYLATNGYTLGNSTNGSNQGDIDQLAQLKTSYEGAFEHNGMSAYHTNPMRSWQVLRIPQQISIVTWNSWESEWGPRKVSNVSNHCTMSCRCSISPSEL